MEDHYIYRGTQKLRCGFTTGSCAAAAAKAAAMLLLSGEAPAHVRLMTPAGIPLLLPVRSAHMELDQAVCAIKKDSGDDPDVTNGILIYAAVCKCDSGMEITGGEGIGTVTKAGLDQPVGASAINSVPRRMISDAVAEIAAEFDYSGGFRIVISAPEGTEIAKKTFNPRMGITGGISIIGTKGIVEPMSNSALIETIRTEAKMRKAAGHENLLLTLGNFSEDYLAKKLPDLAERSVICSNFIGDAIDIGILLGFRRILIVGHLGKLVKLGSGIMNAHSAVADGRMETLIACGVLGGVQPDILRQLADCATTDAALEILYAHDAAGQTLDILAKRIDFYLHARARERAEIGALIFSNQHAVMLKTSDADAILQAISEE